MPHVIFDWNGTLLDDIRLFVECAVLTGQELGWWPPLTLDYYRRHFTRDWQRFYGGLAQRELSAKEIEEIDVVWHKHYETLRPTAGLFDDSRKVLEDLSSRAIPCSLLSLYHHQQLVPLVEQLGLSGFFSRIDGRTDSEMAQSKAEHLNQHLKQLQLDNNRAQVVMIGDNADDGNAARLNGIRAILVTTGEHPRERLVETGWPVVDSLSQANLLI
jgi:phosphoglycolate phosphatase-like HAD superfamily hydrolase